MRLIFWFLCFSISVLCLETYPIGVNLGYRFITAARFTDEDKPELLLKFEGSGEYQSHMRKLASQSGERVYKFGEVYVRDQFGELVPAPLGYRVYKMKDQETINQALRDLSTELSHKLGDPPQIALVNVPEGMDHVAKHHLYETLHNSDSIRPVPEFIRQIGFIDATRSAYDLDSAEGPGPKVPFDEEEFHVLYVDFNAYSLDFWVATISETTSALLERGPFSLRRPDLAASHGDDDESKAKQIHRAVDQFITEFLSTEEETDLQAIIVSGEGCADSMETLGRSLRQIVPQKWQGIIRDQIDPTFVTAIGAAHRVRNFVQRPDRYPPHDEL